MQHHDMPPRRPAPPPPPVTPSRRDRAADGLHAIAESIDRFVELAAAALRADIDSEPYPDVQQFVDAWLARPDCTTCGGTGKAKPPPAPLGDVIKCQRCGKQSRSLSRGCSNCGLGRPEPQPRTWGPGDPEPPAGVDILHDPLALAHGTEPYLVRIGHRWAWCRTPHSMAHGEPDTWATVVLAADGPLHDITARFREASS